MHPVDLIALLPRAGAFLGHTLLRRVFRREGTPACISFLVTSRCALKCQHCFYHEGHVPRDHELTLDEYRRLAAQLDPFAIGLFCGGEPFLRPDLHEIIDVFGKDAGMLVSLTSTNGQATESILSQTEQILRRDRSRPVVLSFSIDGFREQHDACRGGGTFDRALVTYRECQRLQQRYRGLVLGLSSVITSQNQDSLSEFVRWAWKALEPESIGVLLVRQSPRGGDALKAVDPARYREAQVEALRPLNEGALSWSKHPQKLYFSSVARGVSETLTTGRRAFSCQAGRHNALIDPRGDLSACEVLAMAPDAGPIGNLRDVDMDLARLWTSEAGHAHRALVGRHPLCQACTHETMGYLPSIVSCLAKNGLSRP